VSCAAIYDAEFFTRQLPWRHEYDLIADTLVKCLQFSSVLDLGCGPGYMIARLTSHVKTVAGVDGSRETGIFAPAEVRDKIVIRDLTAPLRLGSYDLVICTEVAEHLPAAHADTLVDSICANALRYVFFTAALPGQGGYGHINEQPHEYWITRFRERSFTLDESRTNKLRGDLLEVIRIAYWYPKNALLFSVGET